MNAWPVFQIKEIARVVGGATPKSGTVEYWDGEIPWTTPKDLSDLDGKYLTDTPRKITSAGLKSCSSELLPPNSVLFSSRAPIGHVAINTVPIATNQGFKSFVPGPKLDASFLFWWLKCNRDQLELLGNGATFKEVSKAVVERIEIPLPPLDEQKRIAAIFDQAEELRRKRQRTIDGLHKLGQALFYEMFGDPNANDKKWPSIPVGQVTDCIVPGRDKPKSFSGDIPWITTAEIVHLGLTSYSNAKIALSHDEVREVRAKIVPTNSVIMTCVGDLGKVSIAQVPMVINQQLHSFQCRSGIDPFFLMYMLSHRQSWMAQMATQTTLPYMNKTVCNSVPILLPPIILQKEFSTKLSQLLHLRKMMLSARDSLHGMIAPLQRRAFKGEL
jgi:type I restriction enzyme S subunit